MKVGAIKKVNDDRIFFFFIPSRRVPKTRTISQCELGFLVIIQCLELKLFSEIVKVLIFKIKKSNITQ